MQIAIIDGGGGWLPTFSEQEENDVVMSSEESSSYPDESELELGLGLSLGGGKAKTSCGSWRQYGRILTSNNFPSVVSSKTLLSASSSSSSVTKVNSTGTKRTAESPCSPPSRSTISQVVGWPPVRTCRINSQTSHVKSPVTEELFSTADKCKSQNSDKATHEGSTNNKVSKEKGCIKTSLFVKVNMDGVPIGRKVDLNAHSSYVALARALDDMFLPSAPSGARRSNMEEEASITCRRQSIRLLDGLTDYVLTYEDKDGDWMLVGDVPWEIFLNSVRRLRIMRTTDAKGLAPGCQGRNERQPIALI